MPFDEEDDRPPREGAPGLIREIALAGISSLPAGPLIAALFKNVLAPVVEARREDWFTDLASRVKRLEETRGITLEDLRNDPAFADAVIQASRAADATSSAEKRDALRNAVLNTALGKGPLTADTRHVMLRCVDELTPTHFQILKLIRDHGVQESPTEFNASQGAQPLSYFVSRCVPELEGRGDRPIADLFCLDLINRGLVSHSSGGVGPGANFLTVPIALHNLTDLGQQLLDFIATPPESEP